MGAECETCQARVQGGGRSEDTERDRTLGVGEVKAQLSLCSETHGTLVSYLLGPQFSHL